MKGVDLWLKRDKHPRFKSNRNKIIKEFLLNEPTVNEQLYDRDERPTKEFVGIVLDYNKETKYATLKIKEVKNGKSIDYEILLENYTKTIRVEALTSLKMVKNEIYPVVVEYIKKLAETANALKISGINNEFLMDDLTEFSKMMVDMKAAVRQLEVALYEHENTEKTILEKAVFARDEIVTAMNTLRKVVDLAETKVDSKSWPIPSYIDLMFGI